MCIQVSVFVSPIPRLKQADPGRREVSVTEMYSLFQTVVGEAAVAPPLASRLCLLRASVIGTSSYVDPVLPVTFSFV